MEEKISIVVPVYNVEKYIRECIESIRNQDYKNIQIILIDDGSTDNSGKICDEEADKDKRIKVVHKKNEGVSKARNIGIKMSEGKYICFADGDDYVVSEYISYMYKKIKKNEADILVTKDFYTNFDKVEKKERISILDTEGATNNMLCYKILVGVNGKMYNLKFLRENHIYFYEDLVIGEGFNFNILAFQYANKIVQTSKRIYFYRKNLESVTNKFNENKWNNGIYALEKIKNNINLKNPKTKLAWKYAYWRTNSDAFNQLILSGEKEKHNNFYIKTKKEIKKNAFYSLIVPISQKDRLRAIIMWIYPESIPFIMKIRLNKMLKMEE